MFRPFSSFDVWQFALEKKCSVWERCWAVGEHKSSAKIECIRISSQLPKESGVKITSYFSDWKECHCGKMNDAQLHWATRRLHIAQPKPAGTRNEGTNSTGNTKIDESDFCFLRFAVSLAYSLPRLCHTAFFYAYFSIDSGVWSTDSDCIML